MAEANDQASGDFKHTYTTQHAANFLIRLIWIPRLTKYLKRWPEPLSDDSRIEQVVTFCLEHPTFDRLLNRHSSYTPRTLWNKIIRNG